MLQITLNTQEKLTQESFFSKLHGFLLERTTHLEMQLALSNKDVWKTLWDKFWDKAKDVNEYYSAVILAYVLACYCEKLDPEESLDKIINTVDPEFEMKFFLADHQYLRFSEFYF
jgi:hypothetical protein